MLAMPFALNQPAELKTEKQKQLAFWTFLTLEALLLLGLFLFCFAVFFYFTWEVFQEKDEILDKAAFAFAAAHESPRITQILEFVTYFASKRFLLTVPPTLIIFFLFFKKWRWFSAYILAATMGSFMLNQYLKNNFGRMRPETAFYHQSGFSFPSGHAMIGVAFYGILAYLVWKNVRNFWLRWSLILALIFWELIIAYSRIYLNVHYATDVLAGLSAGIFWCALVIVLMPQIELFAYNRERAKRLKHLRKTRAARFENL